MKGEKRISSPVSAGSAAEVELLRTAETGEGVSAQPASSARRHTAHSNLRMNTHSSLENSR